MARTKHGLAKAEYEYWQKYGFDATLRAKLKWTSDEYKAYKEQQCKKHLTAPAGKSQ